MQFAMNNHPSSNVLSCAMMLKHSLGVGLVLSGSGLSLFHLFRVFPKTFPHLHPLSCSTQANSAGPHRFSEAQKMVWVLPSDIVANSINLCKPISGWFIRPGQIQTSHLFPK